MGEVYRVSDEVSGAVLALKVCRDSIEHSMDAFDLLRDEILLARQISHPNVCRIHELFTTEIRGRKAVFFTMEWLHGETLAQRLSTGGALTVDAILAIAGQAAAGLDAIHKAGIVHRDLKPGNILLASAPEGAQRVVITDFGLASRLPNLTPSGDSAVSESQLIGTLDYMAPEQLLGDPVGPAADVYTLGLIVCEMAAGGKIQRNANVLQTIVRRVAQARPEPSLFSAPIPPPWIGPLTRALSKDPSERYPFAGAFIAALRDAPGETGRGTPSRRTILLTSAAAALSVSAAIAFFRSYGFGPLKRPRPVLMLTPITFSTGEAKERAAAADFAATAETLLQKQLNESAFVNVVPRNLMERLWKRMRTTDQPEELPAYLAPGVARQLALRSESPYVLYGNIAQIADQRVMRLQVEVVGSSVFTSRSSRSRDFVLQEDRDLPGAAYDAAKWIRRTIGEPEAALAGHLTRPEELTTPSWTALAEYIAGDREWRAGRPGPATLHLRSALALDNQFAAAATRLADILMANCQPDDAYLQYASASRILAARNLTDRESLLGRGLFSLDVGLNREADEIFARYILEYPGDPLPKFYKAGALTALNRPDEAEALLTEAIRLSPSTYSYVMGRSRLYLETGRLDEAQRDWERGRAIDPLDWTDQIAMAIAFSRRDLASAGRAIARMRDTGSLEFQSKSFALESCLLAEQERWKEAVTALNRGLEFDKRSGVPRSAIAVKRRLLCQINLYLGKLDLFRCTALEALADIPGQEARLQIECLLYRVGVLPSRRAGDCLTALANSCTSQPTEAALPPRPEDICGTPAGLPAWPIYRYWQDRLKVEAALYRKDASNALRLASSISDPPFRHVFPEHLLRAATAAKDARMQSALRKLLMSQLGRWWLEPERNPPGFFRAWSKTSS
jgi:tetratricopeptide (TPR) repeat protein